MITKTYIVLLMQAAMMGDEALAAAIEEGKRIAKPAKPSTKGNQVETIIEAESLLKMRP